MCSNRRYPSHSLDVHSGRAVPPTPPPPPFELADAAVQTYEEGQKSMTSFLAWFSCWGFRGPCFPRRLIDGNACIPPVSVSRRAGPWLCFLIRAPSASPRYIMLQIAAKPAGAPPPGRPALPAGQEGGGARTAPRHGGRGDRGSIGQMPTEGGSRGRKTELVGSDLRSTECTCSVPSGYLDRYLPRGSLARKQYIGTSYIRMHSQCTAPSLHLRPSADVVGARLPVLYCSHAFLGLAIVAGVSIGETARCDIAVVAYQNIYCSVLGTWHLTLHTYLRYLPEVPTCTPRRACVSRVDDRPSHLMHSIS